MLILVSQYYGRQKALHPRYFQTPPGRGGATYWLKMTVLGELEVRLEQKNTGLRKGWLER